MLAAARGWRSCSTAGSNARSADHRAGHRIDVAIDPRRIVGERLGRERQVAHERAVADFHDGEAGRIERVADADAARQLRGDVMPQPVIEASTGVNLQPLAGVEHVARDQRRRMIADLELRRRPERDGAHRSEAGVLHDDRRIVHAARQPARRDAAAERHLVRFAL